MLRDETYEQAEEGSLLLPDVAGAAHPDGGAPQERWTCPECNVTTVAASKFNAGWRWHGEGCSQQGGAPPPEPTQDTATHCYCCGAGLGAGPSWEPSSDALQAAVDADDRQTGTERVRRMLRAAYAVDFGRAASRPGEK
jgi:hypothetical protein